MKTSALIYTESIMIICKFGKIRLPSEDSHWWSGWNWQQYLSIPESKNGIPNNFTAFDNRLNIVVYKTAYQYNNFRPYSQIHFFLLAQSTIIFIIYQVVILSKWIAGICDMLGQLIILFLLIVKQKPFRIGT